MFENHSQNYFVEVTDFAISTIPVFMVLLLITASFFARRSIRTRSQHVVAPLGAAAKSERGDET